MPYQKALQELRNRAQKAYDQSDFQTWVDIGTLADKLESWIEKGRPGDCPVDLAKLGLESTVDDNKSDTVKPIQEKTLDEDDPIISDSPVLDIAQTSVLPDTVDTSFDEELDLVEEKEGSSLVDFSPDQDEMVLDESEGKIEEDTLESNNSQPFQDAMLYERLEEAQELLDRENWHQALSLCAEIETRAQDLELKERVSLLKADIQAGMNKALSDILEQADLARQERDEELARSSYLEALKIDPENGHAKQALSKMDDLQSGNILSEDEQDRLRAQLKEEKDIVALEEAVRKGEDWDAEGKLPPTLVDLLQEARMRFDALRRQMGQETTMARLDDLGGVKQAWELAQGRLKEGFPYIFDEVLKQNVKTEEYFSEVEEIWASKSRETAQYELDIMNGSLPEHPKVALKRLEQALAKPFHEDSLSVLQEKKREVEKLDEYLNSYQQPLLEDDPLKSLLSFSPPVVESDFSYFEFLENKKENTHSRVYSRAVAALERTVQDCYDKVEIYLGRDTEKAYENAREEIEQAHKILDRWTLEDIPDELKEKRNRADKLKEKVNARQTLHNELHQRIAAIRGLVQDTANRKAGKKRFDELKANNRFADFSAMASFISEMDQYLDAGEKFVNAKLAKQKGDWRRVLEVTESLIQEGGTGAFKDEVNALYEQAGLELGLARAKQFLDGNSIVEARVLLLALKSRSAKLKDDNWHERLRKKLEWVHQCEDNTPQMEQRFSQALTQIHILGSPILRTYLDHSLEKSNLVTLSDWNRDDQNALRNVIGKGVNDSITILEAIEGSRMLLLAALEGVSSKDKVSAMRTFQMIQGSVVMDSDEPWAVSLWTRDAGKMALLLKESVRDYDLKILLSAYRQRESQQLSDDRLFDLSSLANLLREAHLLETESEREAVRWYEVEQVGRRVRGWKNTGDWQSIQNAWAGLRLNHPGHPEVEDGWMEAKRKVDGIEKVLQEFENAPSDILKLKKLKDASASGITCNEPKILSMLREKFVEMSTKLVQTYKTETGKGTEKAISLAVIALHELDDAEKIYDLAEDKKEFNNLYAELENTVRRINPELVKQLPYLGNLYRNLKKVDDPELWKKAILKDDFGELNEIWGAIEKQKLSHLSMAQVYWDRLSEWVEMRENLWQDIIKLRDMFEAEENFSDIVILVDRNQYRPAKRRNGMPWNQLREEDYLKIRDWMGTLLKVTDAYPDSEEGTHGDDRIVGWTPLKKIAKQREIEHQQWETWHSFIIQTGKSIQKEYQEFQAQSLHSNLAVQQEAIEKICRRTIELIEYIDSGPLNEEGEPVLIHSADAENIWLDSNEKIRDVRGWLIDFGKDLDRVNQQIIGLNGFPMQKEFSDAASQIAQRNCVMLERVLARAEAIGAGNSMLMDIELRNAVASARNKNFKDLKVLFGFVKELDDYFSSLSWSEVDTQLQRDAQNELFQRLRNLSVYKVFSDAVKSVQSGQLDLFKRYLKLAEDVRMKRKQEEQNRIQTYKNALVNCQSTSPNFWGRVTNLFNKG